MVGHGVFINQGWNCFNWVAAGMPWGMIEGCGSFHWNCYGRACSFYYQGLELF